MKTITRIIVAVCEFEGINSELFSSKSRKREYVQARQRSMYFAKKYTKLSLTEIGYECGGKDHATVLHANKTVSNLIDTDFEYRKEIDQLDYIIRDIVDLDLDCKIGPNRMQLQIRLNIGQYRNGRYLYTLYGVKKVSRTRTLFIPVKNVNEVFDMINTSEIDSVNIYMDYRKNKPMPTAMNRIQEAIP